MNGRGFIVLRNNAADEGGVPATVFLLATGTAPNLPHAQHVHGFGDMHAMHDMQGSGTAQNGECPGPDRRDDRVDDGLIDTVEGLPDYGPIQVSLTTSGDTSPGSGLAVDRFPVANRAGVLVYVENISIPQNVADNISDHHIVVHGIDTNGNGEYDFSKGPSALNPALPLEATVPAACGQID